MLINLYKDDKDPIYLQIVKQIKKEIMNKNLQQGDLLPSIRALATDLKVSVITTKRAYMELEKDGFIPVSYTHLIGLSIAQSIVQKHKGKISADSFDGERIVFTVKF